MLKLAGILSIYFGFYQCVPYSHTMLHQLRQQLSANKTRVTGAITFRYFQTNTDVRGRNDESNSKSTVLVDRFPNIYDELRLSQLLNMEPKTKKSRHKRETDGGGFLDDPNNIAMFIVFPCMVFIYGGCAVIYCCYKCRNYMNEHHPIRQLKERIRNRKNNTNGNENNLENLENTSRASNENNCTPKARVPVRPKTADKPIKSEGLLAQSSVESTVTFIDMEDEDLHSTVSTPLPIAECNENAERPQTTESKVHTEISAQSFPSLSTVSTKIDSPVHKSVSVQSESLVNRHVYTSIESEHLILSKNHADLIDIGCQTDNPETNKDLKSSAMLKFRVGKMANKRRTSAKTTNPGQIHFVKKFMLLNPYRDDQVNIEHAPHGKKRHNSPDYKEDFNDYRNSTKIHHKTQASSVK